MSQKNLHRVCQIALGILLLLSAAIVPVGCANSGSMLAPATKASATADPVAKAAESLYGGICTEVLPNGLIIHLKPIPGATTVSTMVAYRVGSSDENNDCTGLSHYLEHLMFKGTEKIMPGDIDHMTLRNGGANNAYTDYDETVYHFDFAADRWDGALVVEADRMRNIRIDEKHEFEHEKGAVIEELRRDEDEPWDLENKAIAPMLFADGPYGHPVIGQAEHVRAATAPVIKAHYDLWYHPNNAILVIAGGFDPDAAMARVKELFGPIPRADLPQRKVPAALNRTKPVRTEIPSKFSMARMVMGFNTVAVGDPDDLVLDVIGTILVGDKTGRLYTRLVEKEQLANEVGANNSAGRYPGWFDVSIEVLPGKSREKAEYIALEELKKLADAPVDAAELARAQRSIIAAQIFSQESVHDLANAITHTAVIKDLSYLKEYLPRIAAVTPAQIQAAAKKYFDAEKRAVVWSVPPANGGAGAGVGATSHAPHAAARQSKDASAVIAGPSIAAAKRTVLPNGLTILMLEDHRLPIIAASAEVKRLQMYEPADQAGVAELTGRMLSEGTDKHSGPEIAQMIQSVGGSLAMGAGGGSVQVLAPDRRLGLSLMLECLTSPAFPADEFARAKEQQLSDIEDSLHEPDARAKQEYAAAIYGSHPLGRPAMGYTKTVKPLTPDAARQFHRRFFVPGNTVIAVVGDFDSSQLAEEIAGLTKDWKAGEVPKLVLPEVAMPKAPTEKIVSMADAAQLHFLLGHPGIRRDNPDYFKLLVMDYVLGTGPGFTDRLSSRLRDREGLAYTVTGSITGSAGLEPGTFTCYVGTEAKNFARVRKEFIEEIARIRDTAPTDAEVADAKAYLIGSQPFKLATNSAVSGMLLSVERFGLGFDSLEKFRKSVAAVTPADVQAVAKKHLDPEHMVLVAAGPIDKKGKPLAGKKH